MSLDKKNRRCEFRVIASETKWKRGNLFVIVNKTKQSL